MKKSFIAITALILVFIIVVAVVSCNTCNSCNTGTETESETKLSGSATGNQDRGNYTEIGKAKITVDSVNVRRAASGTSEIVAGLYKDDIIDIISTENGWAKIYYVGKHYEGFGYVSTSCIADYPGETESESDKETSGESNKESSNSSTSYDETDSSGNIVFQKVNDTVTVTADSLLNVRKSPDTDAEVVGTIKKGDKYVRVGISESWSKIVYNNAEYYVVSKYVMHTPVAGETVRKATVVPSSLSIRSEIDFQDSSNILGYTYEDSTVTVIFHDENKFNGWARVYYVDKDGVAVEGWSNAKYLKFTTSSTELETESETKGNSDGAVG